MKLATNTLQPCGILNLARWNSSTNFNPIKNLQIGIMKALKDLDICMWVVRSCVNNKHQWLIPLHPSTKLIGKNFKSRNSSVPFASNSQKRKSEINWKNHNCSITRCSNKNRRNPQKIFLKSEIYLISLMKVKDSRPNLYPKQKDFQVFSECWRKDNPSESIKRKN